MNGPNSHNDPPDERTERELAALADGSLPGRRREALEARVAGSPELRAALERQRSGVAALRGLDFTAPAGLRRRVEAERSRPSGPVRRRRLALGGALAATAAAIVLAVVLIAPSGSGGPTVVQAAELSDLPATEASVPVDPANAKLLDARVDGVSFPNLNAEFAWQEVGSRSDELEGRSTKTVFYEREGQRVGYTILSGEPIDPPDGARASVRNGVRLNTATDGGQAIVTWLREGRTCVVSGEGVSPKDLREVASWKGDGAVPF
jgi:anti-sigma factor RsiW